MLNPEEYDGNIEYKRYLINLDNTRLEELSTQMKWRLTEGNNEAIYYLGVNDDGSPYQMTKKEIKETLFNFRKLVNCNNAEIINFDKSINESPLKIGFILATTITPLFANCIILATHPLNFAGFISGKQTI